MEDPTLDEASRCPKCKELGKSNGESRTKDGSKLLKFICQNERCKWYDGAPWLVQIMPDGTVAKPQKHDKFFHDLPDRTEDVRAAIDRDIARSLERR